MPSFRTFLTWISILPASMVLTLENDVQDDQEPSLFADTDIVDPINPSLYDTADAPDLDGPTLWATNLGDDSCLGDATLPLSRLKKRDGVTCTNPALSNQESDPSTPSFRFTGDLTGVMTATNYWCGAQTLPIYYNIPICDVFYPETFQSLGWNSFMESLVKGPGYYSTIWPARECK